LSYAPYNCVRVRRAARCQLRHSISILSTSQVTPPFRLQLNSAI